MRYQVDRLCPLTGEQPARVIAHVPARVVAAANPTYRDNYAEILGISPDDEFPFVESPAGFVYAGWTPPPDFLRKVYEEVVDHSRTVTRTIPYRQMQLEYAAAFMRLVAEDKTARPMRLLDFGCGYGGLLALLASRDIISVGFDPSAERGKTATADGRFPVLTDEAALAAAGPFDLFVCTEVMEHVPDPRAVLRLFKANAAPGALLALTVPQCEPQEVARAFAELSAEGRLGSVFNPWEHLNYFTAASLRRLLAEECFAVIEDYCQVGGIRLAAAEAGRPQTAVERARSVLRLVRRALRSAPSTQLFCRSI